MAAVNVPWTGFSPTMGANGGATPSLTGTLNDGESAIARKIAVLMRKPQYRAQRALLRALDGVAPGGTAVANRGRVKAYSAIPDVGKLGGVVETENAPFLGATVAGRATVTADVTRLNAMIDEVVYPVPYVNDASGNGGGGKLNR